MLALVPAVEEKVVQELPLFVLYRQVSQVADAEADILNPFAVMLEVLKVTVGAVRSMVFRVMVVDAVIVPMEVPE